MQRRQAIYDGLQYLEENATNLLPCLPVYKNYRIQRYCYGTTRSSRTFKTYVRLIRVIE